ncbi:hypothetical protein PGTUg99_009115 [Puccinia graminis f. sp. tritici]|uniref:Uncharacterized protein n=1 Tax=Puccinia graminis f. sp. tritici TaxID=56615 RepID=A0A5B0RYC2_PUCGR|nr:hypothetical protein PGTUg99_009115 [Puccinia graminis f. sp. tritici]
MVTLHPDIRADADIRLLFPGKAASASASGYPPPWRVSERISSDTRPLNGRRGTCTLSAYLMFALSFLKALVPAIP